MPPPWPLRSKNGFWNLFAWGKSPKVSVLEAEAFIEGIIGQI